MVDKLELKELKDALKEHIEEKSVKWTSSHIRAFREIMEVIDDNFCDSVLHTAENIMHDVAEKANEIKRREYILEKEEQDLQEAKNTFNKLTKGVVDEKAKRSLLFAVKLSRLYEKMDPDVMQCVSYGLYAYLTGKEPDNPSAPQILNFKPEE